MRNYKGPGRYRHFKGGLYDVLGLAPYEDEDGKITAVVVYKPIGALTHPPVITGQTHYTRRLDSFNGMVRREHGEVPRFARESDLEEAAELIENIAAVIDRYTGPATAREMEMWGISEARTWSRSVAGEIVSVVLRR